MNAAPHRPFVAGNWKMHKTQTEARELAAAVAGGAAGLKKATVVLCPPFTALTAVGRVLALAQSTVALGAQDVFWETQGAFTGEVSAPMLADAGCAYVIIGHSERREHFGETDAAVNRKITAALAAGVRPIVCVGETLPEREAGRTMDKVGGQLEAGLAGISAEDASGLIIAYEPIWAIGTGRTATPSQAQEVHAFIRSRLREKYGDETADCVIILYGGSVKPANSSALFREKDIDGFLVGGASLEADSFLEIARAALRTDKDT